LPDSERPHRLPRSSTESLTKAGLVLGDLVVTGPTRTNVSDFRAILLDGV
jgi:glycerate-2-kinase